MRIITRCPACRNFMKHKKKKCKCGNKIKDRIYYIEYRENGLKRRKIGHDLKIATIALAEVEKSILNGTYGIKKGNYNLTSLLDWYLNLSEVRIRRQFKETKRSLSNFCSRLPQYIGQELLEGVLNDQKRRMDAVSHSTINRDLAYLKAFLNTAVKYGEIPFNPIARIRLLPESKRKVDISPEGVSKILESCDKRIYGIIYTLSEILCRKEEVTKLVWDEVDLKGGFIRLSDERVKNGEGRVVPLSPGASSFIKRLPSRFEGKYVFEQVPNSTLHRLYKSACATAGYPDMCIHSLRHYVANQYRLKGFSDLQIISFAGWKTAEMLNRYTHVSEDEVKLINWG